MVRTCSAMSAWAAASLARLASAELLAALRSRSRWSSPRIGCCAATVKMLVLMLRAITPVLPGGPRVMTKGASQCCQVSLAFSAGRSRPRALRAVSSAPSAR